MKLSLAGYLNILIIFAFNSLANAQQCNYYPSTSSTYGCVGNSYTLYATTFGSTVSSHRWYSVQTGGTPIGGVSQNSSGYGILQSSLTAVFNSSVTYYVAAVCSDGTESGRVAVSFTANTPSTITYSSSIDPLTLTEESNLLLTAAGGLNYEWRYKASNGEIVATGTTFSPKKGGAYYLSGTNNCNLSQTVLINVNYLPYANAGSDQYIGTPATYTIYGSGGDSDGDAITFSWTRLSPQAVTTGLANASPLQLSNVPVGTHVFRLTVTDSWGKSSSDDVTIYSNTLVNNYNFGVTEIVKVPGKKTNTQLASLSSAEKNTEITYVDGISRTVQNVQQQFSPSGNDIISVTEYDELSRPTKNYLPLSTTQSNGNYLGNILGNGVYQGSVHYNYFNNSADKIADDAAPYSATTYEASPLARPLLQGYIGNGYQPISGQNFKTISYKTNSTENIRKYSISGNGLPISNNVWAYNRLSIKSVINESNVETQEISNSEGLKLVSRMKFDALNWAETYFVYNDRGQLMYVLPPELIRILANTGNYNPTQNQLDTWAYQYKYDDLDREVESRNPGVDNSGSNTWSYSVYDSRDRVVLSQDGKQRLLNEWSYTKYDELDRPVVSGVYRPGVLITRSDMQTTIDGLSAGLGFQNQGPPISGVKSGSDFILSSYESINEYKATNSITLKPGFTFKAGVTSSLFRAIVEPSNGVASEVFPQINDEPLVKTYYDTYDCAICADPNFQFVAESWSASSNEPFQKFTQIKDKVVANSIKILGTSTWLNSVVYYNRQGQTIQTIDSNHLGGFERNSSLIDFSGKTLQTLTTYVGMSIPLSTVLQRFDYDAKGRVLKVYHKINSQPEVTLTSNEYNDLGQLVDKSIHSSAGSAYIQSIDYRYNIRGNIVQMNSITGDSGDPYPDYFRIELGYENTFGSLNTPKYDGTITGIKWKNDKSNKEQGYGFDYNNAGWLISSNYKLNNSDNWSTQNGVLNEDGLSYDYNGNIQQLNRKLRIKAANAPVIDQLQYNYGSSGNRLLGVTDNAPATDKEKGFKDGNTVGDDYVYDINGNLVQDKNKNISITYNFLNLMDRITLLADNSYLKYTYDAGGIKLKQEYFNSSNQLLSKTDYLGEVILLNDQIQLIHHSEGRIIPPDYTNLIANPTREGGSLEGYTANGTSPPTLTAEVIATQTYVKAVCNQSTNTSGIYPVGGTFTVKPGESYQFTVLGYQSVGTNARLYVWGNNGDIIWAGSALPVGAANETFVSANFVVPAGVTQIKVGILWNSGLIGYTLYINRVALYKTDFEYQYFLTDQVGSPRVILQTGNDVETLVATMEPKNYSNSSGTAENDKFLNLNSTRETALLLANATPGGSFAYKMNIFSNSDHVGPARSFKVFPGDQIDASVMAYYATGGTYTKTPLASMASYVATALAGGVAGPIDAVTSTSYGNSVSTLDPKFILSKDQGSTKPSAFINYILFDDAYVPLEAKSVPVGSANSLHQISLPTILPDQKGYLYIYLSYDNEAGGTDVYFDDLRIVHTKSPVIQISDYYPFGLVSFNWIREGESENKFLFQGKEYIDKSGFQDFGSRMYTGELGRWFSNDPARQFSSPYNGMGNKPVMGVDSNGEFFLPILIGAVMGALTQGSVAWVNHQDVGESLWKGALVGGIGGALGQFGGGSFLKQVLWGAGEGSITGGIASAVNGGNFWDGALQGGAWGAGFATLTATSQSLRNYFDKEKYGFGTHDGISDKLVDEAVQDYTGKVDPAKAMRAIDFIKKRYGMSDGKFLFKEEMTYTEKSSGYAYTVLSSGEIGIGTLAFENNSSSMLKSTMIHEYLHVKLDRIVNEYGFGVKWTNPKRATWNFKDGVTGYAGEIRYSGIASVRKSTLNRIDSWGRQVNPVWYRIKGQDGFFGNKYFYMIPRRFKPTSLL